MTDERGQTNTLPRLVVLWLAAVIALSCALPGVGGAAIGTLEPANQPSTDMEWLADYRANLIEEFRADLAELADAPRYRIEVEIGEEIANISGSLEVIYTNRMEQPLEEIYFRLFPNMSGDYLRVEDVHVNGEPADAQLAYKNTALRVNLPAALPPGQSATITMAFDQRVPSEMGGNYGLYIYQEDILALDAFFPIIPVANENGWQVGDPPPNADMTFNEVAFFRVQVSAPSNLVLVASGMESETTEEDARRTTTFIGGPQRDFYLAASPRFASQSMQVGGTLLTSYFPGEYRASGEMVLLSAAQALVIFSELYGSYPYARLDLVSTPMQAGGMEYSGVAALALNLYDTEIPDDVPPGTLFLESAVAHEVAHQWFFNQVMNDPLNEPWLDEGLAQYLAYIYYRENYGHEVGDAYVGSWRARWRRIDDADIPINLPAASYSPLEYSAIVYGRAPLFMMELQRRLGDERFNAFLRDYVETFRWRIVTSADFKSLIETSCGCDLSALFAGWVESGGEE